MRKLNALIKCSLCGKIKKREDVIFMSRYKDRWDLRSYQEIAYCRDDISEYHRAVTWLRDASYDL